MPKIGLKLWSTNLNYILAAGELFSQGVFDYIELFTVPGSVATIANWKELKVPYILHAPHSYAGLNPADCSRRDLNMELVAEVNAFFDALNPDAIIFHPGMGGNKEEAVFQMSAFGEGYPAMYDKVLIENKPKVGQGGEACLGDSPEDIRFFIDRTGRGFCLDFGHAICYAVAAGREWKSVLADFLVLAPQVFHLSDGFFSVHDAHEHLGEGEFDIPYLVGLIGAGRCVTLETKKNRADSLADFVVDVRRVKKYAGI